MELVRAWPSRERADRSRVVDDARRVPVDDYDYRGLLDVGDDVVVLDWDIAPHREDVVEFGRRAALTPERPLVAPYMIYPDTRPGLRGPTWPMRRFVTTDTLRYVTTGEPACHLFGFGMTYLPRALLEGFVADKPGLRLDDTAFASWGYLEYRWEVPITWDLRPVHLNYRVRSIAL